MGIWNNVKKTYYYSKKNGIKNACYAAAERILSPYYKDYKYIPINRAEEEEQRRKVWDEKKLFSVVVPAYRTEPKYLRELIESVLEQTYPYFELIIADAGGEVRVEEIVKEYPDERIRYLVLKENLGISANTNVAIKEAKGDYIGLLDHDDLLTKDALYEMACKIEEHCNENKELVLLYSDEDKCDKEAKTFYEPHFKCGLNVDLILSNNYICHFMVAKRELFQELLLRPEYDGAQDYDFVLRSLAKLWERKELIGYIPKVLYHWRCHEDSTSANPQSKMYAYEAGKRALQDFVQNMEWQAEVSHGKHLGYYRVEYKPDIFTNRKEVGVIGGRVIHKNKNTGVILSLEGEELYKGVHFGYAGYMNGITVPTEVLAVDIRNMQVAPEVDGLYKEIVGLSYNVDDAEELSLRFCEEVRKAGYKILYFPFMSDVRI